MIRFTGVAVVCLAASVVMTEQVWAAEATLRARGGDQTFTGNITGFDGQAYEVEGGVFGTVYLDAKLFECVSGACPGTAKTVEITPAGPSPQKSSNLASPRGDRLDAPTFSHTEKLQLFQNFLDWRNRKSN